MGFQTLRGEAMAMGERTPIAAFNAPASGRMAIGEAITNIAAADVRNLGDIKLSANWMAAAGHGAEDAALFDTVEAVGMHLCPALGISIPVGKDSLSMKTVWQDGAEQKSVVAPVSLIVSAFAPLGNAARTLTPLLADTPETELVLVDLGRGKNRMGASALAQTYRAEGGIAPDVDDAGDLRNFFSGVRELADQGLILAYHDRSDGGLIACVSEIMFASHRGVTLYVDALIYAERESDVDEYEVGAEALKLGANSAMLAALFNEELGAVLQIRTADRTRVMEVLRSKGLGATASRIGHPNDADELRIVRGAKPVFVEPRSSMQRAWSETSFRIQALRDNPATARQQYDDLLDGNSVRAALPAQLAFNPQDDVAAPFLSQSTRPRVAILREQGVNGQVEMAHAFTRAGFEAVDVHMSDVLAGRVRLEDFVGLAACGGFSYGDVLGAGEGWAKSILFNSRARDQFSAFFSRKDSFALGVCNGCQMMSNLSAIIPGAENWPHFERNLSEQYEARTVAIRLRASPSLFFTGMDGSVLPVPTAHGEGRAVFRDAMQRDAARWLCAAEFVDGEGAATERFPANPNGSPLGMTAFTTPDGRFTIMMPHPERATLNANLSWRPTEWAAEDGAGAPAQSPWARMFANARRWVG
jgi:phosphoribosylformylglycinamidine synthase